MEGVCGYLNSEENITFDVLFDDGIVENFNPDKKFPLIKGSKSHEKGSCLPFSGIESGENQIEYQDLTNTILIKFQLIKTRPLIKISCKLPNPKNLEISEFYLQGYIDFEKIIINKRVIESNSISEKLEQNRKVTIAEKLHVEIIGLPLMKQQSIETEVGTINRIRNKLAVEF